MACGGGHIVIGQRLMGQRESMRGARYDSIKPLLEAQPYVKSVSWSNDFSQDHINVDFGRFRVDYVTHQNLALQHARYARVAISLEKRYKSLLIIVVTVGIGK